MSWLIAPAGSLLKIPERQSGGEAHIALSFVLDSPPLRRGARVVLHHRQRQCEPSVGIDEVAAVHAGDGAGDRQTEAAATELVERHEPVEDVLLLTYRDAGPIVGDVDLDHPALDANLDLNARDGASLGVVEHVGERLLQALSVGLDERAVRGRTAERE